MLRVIASERIEPLVADLARELVESPADPMTPEWIAVGSDGLARWLQLELARHLGASDLGHDGIAANLIMARPGSLRTAVVLAGTDQPEHDPWLTNQLTWSVLETLHTHSGSDARLATFADDSSRSTYRRARQIAGRFASYQLYRPEMIRAWLREHDVDASGSPLSPAQAWQPHLWRLVRLHVGVESPAERLSKGLEVIRSDPSTLRIRDTPLPPRLIFFGPSLLPTGAGFLEVADAVADHREVLVYVIEPSAALSDDLRSRSSEFVEHYDRSHDVSAAAASHPLLRSWGRLQRETALLLADQPLAMITSAPVGHDTLLGALQSRIHGNDEPTGTFTHDPDDRSISLHRCYGPTRQVEALKDTLLQILNDATADMTEDDIVVACPSLESFAPLITAHFGPSAGRHLNRSGDETPLLRYRITGLPSGFDNPVTEGLVSILRIVSGRFEVDEVMDLLALPAVTNRFHWNEDHLERISGWLDDTNVRWGIDGSHRAGFDMPPQIGSYTWRTALDQLIMGTAVRSGSTSTIGGTVPVGLAAGDTELLGQLAAVIAKLEDLVRLAREPRTISGWSDILSDAIDALLAPDQDAGWQADSTRRQLLRLVDTSRLATTDNGAIEGQRPDPSSVVVTFREISEMFDDVVAEQRGRSDFFRGGITFTTLNALRNVPAKVICILGADQGAFTSGGIDSDDLIGTDPRLGDRDPRAEVRQTLLDALLAARERFIVFSDGTDVRTNTVIPPAVVVSELLDAIDATCAPLDPSDGPGGDVRRRSQSVSERITIEHPRQPFAESYFDEQAVSGRSFSRSSLAAALQRRARTTGSGADGSATQRTGMDAGDPRWPGVVLDDPVVDTSSEIGVDALRDLIRRPTKVFLQDGLGIRLPDEVDVRSAELPLEGDVLVDWKLGTELLEHMAGGGDPKAWADRQIRLGNAPPLSLASERFARLERQAASTVAAATAKGIRPGERRVVPVEAVLDDGRRLTGQVRVGRFDDGATGGAGQRVIASMSFSRTKHTQLLGAWVELLAIVATDDSVPCEAMIINRPTPVTDKEPDPRPTVRHLRADGLDAATARRTLTMLARLHDHAVHQPVPLFPDVFGPDPDVEPASGDWKHRNKPLPGDVQFVYGDISLWELMDLTAEGHPMLPPGAPRAQAYADIVWDAFHSTVRLVPDATVDTGIDVIGDMAGDAEVGR